MTAHLSNCSLNHWIGCFFRSPVGTRLITCGVRSITYWNKVGTNPLWNRSPVGIRLTQRTARSITSGNEADTNAREIVHCGFEADTNVCDIDHLWVWGWHKCARDRSPVGLRLTQMCARSITFGFEADTNMQQDRSPVGSRLTQCAARAATQLGRHKSAVRSITCGNKVDTYQLHLPTPRWSQSVCTVVSARRPIYRRRGTSYSRWFDWSDEKGHTPTWHVPEPPPWSWLVHWTTCPGSCVSAGWS